jgi:hypothetical protein
MLKSNSRAVRQRRNQTISSLPLASLLAEAGRNCLFIMLKSGFIGFKRTLITGIYYESYSNQ